MARHLRPWLAGLAAAVSLSAAAADETDLAQCLQAGTASAQAACLYAIRDQEDVRLNLVYRQAMQAATGVSAGAASQLKKAELDWIRFRDDWCAFQAEWEQGTLGKTARAYCLALQTRDRADALAPYASAPAAASRGPVNCQCQHGAEPFCPSMRELYRVSGPFRTNLRAALKKAGLAQPDWVPNGVQGAGFPGTAGARPVLVAFVGEPHNAPHQLAAVFTCATGRVAGVFVEDATIGTLGKPYGKPTSAELDLIKQFVGPDPR